MFEFLWPWAFLTLLLPVGTWLLAKPLNQNALALYVPQISTFQLGSDTSQTIKSTRKMLALLVVLGWLALSAALARPQWTGEAAAIPTMHRDMVLVLDISGSMGNTDMTVDGRRYTRLAVAKYVINEFIEERDGDRIGVILFGTLPYVYVPLTADTEAAGTMLQEAPIGIAGRSTAIGEALGLAVKQLINHPSDHRVAILMTDGNSNAGELSPTDAAELARAEDVRIYTIGLEPQSGLSSFFGNTIQLNTGGGNLDTELLQHIASQTGGQYFAASNVNDLLSIYEEIDQLEPLEQESMVIRPIRSLFHIPLSVALALFGLAAVLRLQDDA